MYVTIDHLTKTIRHHKVLRNVNLGLERGRVYGIVGPNGSGKTMLLRAICGFIRPTSGTVSIDGKPVEFNRRLPANVGVIIETPGFVLGETGMQNLRYLAGLNHAWDGKEVERLLKLFGLYAHRDEKVKSYSLGMRQKLAIVQALMEHQTLILLDEPTNGLDAESVEAFLGEMKHQRALGNTVVIASHHDGELVRIADELRSIVDGRMGEPDAEYTAADLPRSA